MKRVSAHITIATLIAIMLLLNGCDSTLDPIAEDERFSFSIYGFLDASRQNNWIRIMPVRESTTYSTDSIGVTVSLENLNTSEKVFLDDSLFISRGGTAVWNFLSDLEINPGQSYRLEADNPEGVKSSVEVIIPPDFPAPVLDMASGLDIYIYDVEHLVDVQSIWHARNINTGVETVYNFRHMDDIQADPAYDRYIVSVDTVIWRKRLLRRFACDEGTAQQILDANFELLHRQIFVVSGGPEWEEYEGYDQNELSLPDVGSNVENGIGFVFGAVTKTVPWKSCKDEIGNPVACPTEPDAGYSIFRIDREPYEEIRCSG